jgi:hypothetical protein
VVERSLGERQRERERRGAYLCVADEELHVGVCSRSACSPFFVGSR